YAAGTSFMLRISVPDSYGERRTAWRGPVVPVIASVSVASSSSRLFARVGGRRVHVLPEVSLPGIPLTSLSAKSADCDGNDRPPAGSLCMDGPAGATLFMNEAVRPWPGSREATVGRLTILWCARCSPESFALFG